VVREVALVVRLSEDERTSWRAAARAAGWGKTAGWVRSVVASAVPGRSGAGGATSAARSSTPASIRQLDPRVLGELSAIGSNVNQLARVVNAAARGGQPLALEAAAVEALRVDVLALTAAVKAASAGTSIEAPTSTPSSTSSSGEQP